MISGCVTCNRTYILDRWLGTRVKNDDYSKSKTTILICDDTNNTGIKRKNKLIVNNYKKIYPGKIIYTGKTEKKRFSELLIKHTFAQIPEDLIDFTLSITQANIATNFSGSNRNYLLLSTAGYNLFSSDDDIEYRFFSKNTNKNTRYYFTDNYKAPFIFYPDMKTLTSEYKQQSEVDLINTFKTLIGSKYSTLLNNVNADSIEKITPLTGMLIEQDLVQVKAIGVGYLGGRWYQNPYMPLLHYNVDKDNFFHNYNKYIQIRDNGLNVTLADGYMIDNNDFLMGGSYCIDNRKLISPYLPLGIRDDTNFAIILNKCINTGLKIHLPFAQYHNPADKQHFTYEDFNTVSINIGVYSTLILEKLTLSFFQPAGQERLRELGFRFQQFGKMKTLDFEEQLKLLQLGYLSKTMSRIKNLLDLYEREPIWWAEDMEKYYELLKKEALSSESVVPSELRSSGTKEESLAAFQNYIFKCGEMLQWWPEIWEAARVINMERRGIIDL